MNVSRRKFITILGSIAGVLSAIVYLVLKYPYNIIKEKMMAKNHKYFAIDVLVVGGGVQGLILLNALKQNGYSTVLVTNSELGTGQTLHSHGILNSGYPYPRKELRDSLKEDWLPFARRNGLQIYGENHFYILTPPELLAKFFKGWDAFGYEHEIVSRDKLPTGFQEGGFFPGNNQTQIVKIKEYTFPKRQLIRILSDGVLDRIITGRITAFQYTCEESDRFRKKKGENIYIESVEIQRQGSGQKVSLKPDLVIAATGTGTRRFVESLVTEPSFTKCVSESGDDIKKQKEMILSQLAEVTFRNTHMICIRAPKDILPAVNFFVIEHRLMIISANVNPAHDSISDDPDGYITWYVTPIDPNAVAARDVPDTAQGRVEEKIVAEGINRLLKVYPSLKAKAEKADSKIQFFVYAGYKQDIGKEKNHPFCKQLEGISNVIVTLPSLFTGAFVNAKKVLKFADKAMEPRGFQIPVAGTAEGLNIGKVTENKGNVKWMTWKEFLKAFPGIDA